MEAQLSLSFRLDPRRRSSSDPCWRCFHGGHPPPLPNSSNSPPESAILRTVLGSLDSKYRRCVIYQLRYTPTVPLSRSQTRPKGPPLLHILRRDSHFHRLFIPSVAGQCVLYRQVRPCQLRERARESFPSCCRYCTHAHIRISVLPC